MRKIYDCIEEDAARDRYWEENSEEYEVVILQVFKKKVKINALSEDDAIELAKDRLEAEIISLDYDDMVEEIVDIL